MGPRRKPDVVVVGLGPVGTMLAGLLGRLGLHVVGVDRATDVFPLPRAAHIDHTGLRALQQLGCLDELLPKMIVNPGIDFVTPDEQLLARIPGAQPNPSGLPASMYFYQPVFDRTMRRVVSALPTVDLHVGTEVVAVEQSADGPTVRAVSSDGAELEFQPRYAVACDGASSPVRESLGIELVDLKFHERWLVVDLRLSGPLDTLPGRAVTYCDPHRPLGFVPMPENRCRFELMLLDGEDSVAMQDPAVVEQLVSRWAPPGGAELERAAVYAFHGLIAEPWRVGRVLLAGDAAHQMPPFLGQGMNSGLRDAMNLSWKLGFVLRDRAPETLLDTYELERKPHVRSIVETSVRIGRIVCILDPVEAEQRNRDFLAEPNTPTTKLAFRLPQLQPGALVLETGGQIATQAKSRDGTQLFDDVVGQRFLVLARSHRALDASAAWWVDKLGALVTTFDGFPDFAASLAAWLDRIDADIIVVRPDRYVLAAGNRLDTITEQVKSVFSVPTRVARS